MRIARVFPTRTSMTPIDHDAYYDIPDLFTPNYDEIHISVTFTWDIWKAKFLAKAWEKHGKVKMGGCALDDPGGEFVGGKYLRQGVTITSRGCPNNCPFCFVPKREGGIRELQIVEGNIVQDNNILACSKTHWRYVIAMLKPRHRIDFSGGLESARITDEIVEDLRGLRIYQLWLAYDYDNADKPLRKAVDKLSKYFKRDKIRCYVLIGYKDDTIAKAETRLVNAWEIGTLPFAMLYRDSSGNHQSKEWRRFQREWTRPAIIKANMNL